MFSILNEKVGLTKPLFSEEEQSQSYSVAALCNH